MQVHRQQVHRRPLGGALETSLFQTETMNLAKCKTKYSLKVKALFTLQHSVRVSQVCVFHDGDGMALAILVLSSGDTEDLWVPG